MAVNQATTEMTSGRKFGIGANVAVAVIAAAALVGAINYFGSFKKVTVRKDIAASGYGLSDRTKQLMADGDSKINISMLYQPDDTLDGNAARGLGGPRAREVKRRAQALGF